MTENHNSPDGHDRPEIAAWNRLVDALRDAGTRLAADTAELSRVEQADGFRALLRAVTNQLARFEVDRDRPELVAFNQWRQKFMMDNPDFQYWVADVRADGRYRIRGNRADAHYVSITAYATAGGDPQATSRIDSDTLHFDEFGNYDVVVGGESVPGSDWLGLPERASAIWVRHFHERVHTDEIGWCRIDPVGTPPVPQPIAPERFAAQLTKLATMASLVPQIWSTARAADEQNPNRLRHWDEMSGGAVFTEPGIHYLRGGWRLAPDEALVIEGELPPCRYWNILAYSRFLNSLDHRYRPVSYTGATATLTGNRYRFVVSGTAPAAAAGDWIDTENRPFGVLVMRFLQPERPPELPTVRRIALADLGADS